MTKKLRQVATENPSVDYIRPGKEKAFARLHKVLKTGDANGNDDEVFKGSKVKVAPRPGKSATPDSSPKDSYGKGLINNYDDKNTGRHEETEVNEIKDVAKRYLAHVTAHPRVSSVPKQDKRPFVKALQDRTSKRQEGIKRATARVKEETEVNELSNTKLSQYIAKVPNDKGKHNKGIKRAVYKITQGKPKYKKLGEETDLDEGRKPHPPLKGHPYHEKSDAELHYIIKDAGEAAHAMRGHSPHSEGKYLDQVNDASTVLGHRRRGGHQVVAKKNEETITELSNRILHSYIKGAKTQRNGAARMSNTTTKGSTLHKGLKGLVKQRNNGISNATHKIAERPNRYEETEVNELSMKTLDSYSKKSGAHLQKGTFAAGKDAVKNALRKNKNRQKGEHRATERIAKHEETEVVNEISKDKLSAYVAKAKAGSTTGKKLDYTPFGKRSRGITQANRKLRKEDLQNDPSN